MAASRSRNSLSSFLERPLVVAPLTAPFNNPISFADGQSHPHPFSWLFQNIRSQPRNAPCGMVMSWNMHGVMIKCESKVTVMTRARRFRCVCLLLRCTGAAPHLIVASECEKPQCSLRLEQSYKKKGHFDIPGLLSQTFSFF